MENVKIPIHEKCQKLAESIYRSMHFPGSGGANWDKYDDQREIDKIAAQIMEIAAQAYAEGTDDSFRIFSI